MTDGLLAVLFIIRLIAIAGKIYSVTAPCIVLSDNCIIDNISLVFGKRKKFIPAILFTVSMSCAVFDLLYDKPPEQILFLIAFTVKRFVGSNYGKVVFIDMQNGVEDAFAAV